MLFDNQGWGLRTMLIYSCILLSCLLISAYFISTLYHDVEHSLEENEQELKEEQKFEDNLLESSSFSDLTNYVDLEEMLQDATFRYIEKKGSFDESLVVVYSEELIDGGYMSDLIDSNGNVCSGYSQILVDDGDFVVNPYIICNNYKTDGY